MKGKTYTIGEFAKLTGMTTRTLRFYDQKGLLKPAARNDQGHRFYTEEDLLQLQKIMTLKLLDFTLEEIAAHLHDGEMNLQHSLDMQYELLKRKKSHLERVLHTVSHVRQVVQNFDQVDSCLLLVLIHSVQYEEDQKKILSKHLPEPIVEELFMANIKPQERLKLEREMTQIIIELKAAMDKQKGPDDVSVLQWGGKLLDIIMKLVNASNDSGEEITWEELEQIFSADEDDEDIREMLDPMLFPSYFNEEEEQFLETVLEKVIERRRNGECQI